MPIKMEWDAPKLRELALSSTESGSYTFYIEATTYYGYVSS